MLWAVHADAFAHAGQRLQHRGKSLGHGGRGAGNASEGQHGLIQLLDVVDQVFPLERQSFHLLLDGCVGRLDVLELSALFQHGPGSIGVELIAVTVKRSALETRAAKMAGIAMTSIMAATIDENSGRCMIRPRRALNQSRRPRTAKTKGVVASATKAAESARTRNGSLASSSRYCAQRPITSSLPLASPGNEEFFVEAASKPRGWPTKREERDRFATTCRAL